MDMSFRTRGQKERRDFKKQCALIAAFPVAFAISGVLLPDGDPIDSPHVFVFFPLFLCGAVAMFVSARLQPCLRRTKLVLAVVYTLIVLELAVWLALAQ